jgi:hypothetical protein
MTMNMKGHILAALREKYEDWETLLSSLSEEQITDPLSPSHWSIKDFMSHLWAWQQRSCARFEAARLNREPEFPQWVPGIDPDGEGNADRINAYIFETRHELPWSKVYQDWKDGFQWLLELGEEIPEMYLLSTGIYTWLGPYPLAYILLASYDHHQEHYEKLLEWLHARR